MNGLTIIAFLITSLVYAQSSDKQLVYSCLQEEIDMSEMVPEDFLETYEEKYGNRKLQNQEPQPIRITLDFKELDNVKNGEGLTANKKEYIKKIMYAAQIYLSKLIKVNPRQQPIKFLKYTDICYDVKVSQEIRTDGIYDSDLHIFVTYTNQEGTTLADAISCQLDPYPNVGRVKFNIGTMIINEDDTQSFQDNFTTSLHEIIHILGFSGSNIQYWIDPDTGKPYGLTNAHKIMKRENRWDVDNVLKIFSKNILRVSRNHYGCPLIDGMYLENQGKVGSFSSHWERDLLGNEFMTASLVYRVSTISEFTAALLLDTGYYAEVNSNLLMPIYWGKNKGCDFFNKSCNTSQQFPEFPDDSEEESCDFFSQGIGKLQKAGTFTQCKTVTINNNLYCYSDQFKANEFLRQNTGSGSKCFRSNASIKGYEILDMKGRCFKAQCASDLSSIQVSIWGDEYVTCKYPNQVISLSEQTINTQGIMKCPHDFDLFCNFPKSCPNNCSNNGICNNGYCICLKQYAGADCSQKCEEGQVWDGARCAQSCPFGQFKNFDNTCKPTCPYKQYGDRNTGSCVLCPINCSACFGPTFNQCLSCNNGFMLQGNQCIEFTCHSSCYQCSGPNANQCTSCPSGKYLDSNKTCQSCQQPCENCFNEATECTTCAQGYKMNTSNGRCESVNKCDSSCLECSDQRNPTKCTSCRNGYTLDYQGKCQKIICFINEIMLNNQCVPCDKSCEGCVNNPKTCINCAKGYKFDFSNKNCVPKCNQDDFLDRYGNCQQCQPPCATCEDFNNNCISCVNGYTLNTNYNSCELKNQKCHESCNSCNRYNDSYGCTSCRDGMYLNSGRCLPCNIECQTCEDASYKCTSCKQNEYLSKMKCKQCHASCLTCSDKETNCTSCKEGFQKDYNSGLCVPTIKNCQFDEYLDKNYQCQKCNSPCVSCYLNPNRCTSCISGYVHNTQTNQCEINDPICDYDQFLDSYKNCKPCHQSCATCEGYSTKCTSCKNGFILLRNACYEQRCSEGFFLNYLGRCVRCDDSCLKCDTFKDNCTECANGFTYEASSQRCIKILNNNQCHPTCQECNQPNNSSACTSCKEGLQKDYNSGLCVPTIKNCQFDEYLDINYQCQKCNSPCFSCYLNPNQCTSCISGYVHNTQTNQCEINDPICDYDQFLDSYKNCKPCHQSCATCEGYSNKCTSCKNGFILFRNACYEQKCSEGFFLNNFGRCVRCDDSCLKCDTFKDNCTECANGFTYEASSQKCIKILNNNQCHPTCQECSQPNNSSACTSCNDGYFIFNGMCIQCSSQCLTCKRKSNFCTQCKQGFRLDSIFGRCIQDCQQRYYFNQTNNQCQPCLSPCENCEYYSYRCTSCIQGYKYDNDSFACEIDCKPGEYKNTIQSCKQCSFPCLTCEFDDNRCLSCVSGYTYRDYSCQKNSRSNFRACHESCNTCIKAMDPHSCDSCREGYTLINGTCYKK
ncbi:leishmanolysin family protein (macronuclear) [Tetrahymena thermophila SB210]|uniref:Leishmanolysin family protein n=1 Tax=Tetrahymena thermophila (strain SB210) TaxID=312017 RepID=I7M6S2_TETTS|nr:leishmanolysin family protein [Tetrahymena thermophila SB210]EAR86017.1 leishmanolysin family protein [Tetrahymena thermophila SB210]|eukprot:XP_976612.1 leishmanolysin family protein [Tetrahymena thermophila SB210]